MSPMRITSRPRAQFAVTSLAGIDRFGAPLRARQSAFVPRKLPPR